jgi:hypothetical protein
MTKLDMIVHGPYTMVAIVILLVCCAYARFSYISWLWKNKRTNRENIAARDYLSHLKKDDPVRATIWIGSQVLAVVLLLFILISMFFR